MYTLVPFRRSMTNAIPALFNDHFMREFFNIGDSAAMRVDVREKDDAYLLEAELPGVEKENISLSVQDGVLTISADRNIDKKTEKNGYVCSERRSGHVERSFNMEGIDVSAIRADYQNGVLTVELPRAKEQEKNAIKIAIGQSKEESDQDE